MEIVSYDFLKRYDNFTDIQNRRKLNSSSYTIDTLYILR